MDHMELEKYLMEMILAGEDIVLVGLRTQYHNSIVSSRKFTGAGFYTDFQVQNGIEPVAEGKSFQIGDINAAIGGIKNAVGFILFVKSGYLSFLEGYTLASDFWPIEYNNIVITYDGQEGMRDYTKLKANWA